MVDRTGFGPVCPRPQRDVSFILVANSESNSTSPSRPWPSHMRVRISSMRLVPILQGTHFIQDESCGKCVPCRIGSRRMLEILTRICDGQGREGDVELLSELATKIKETSLCGLGQTGPNPVLSTIRYFRHEYDDL